MERTNQMQGFEVKQKTIAQITHRPGAQLDCTFMEKLFTNFFSLLSPQVSRQTYLNDELVTKALTRPNDPTQRFRFHPRMRWIHRAFLLSFHSIKHTLAICNYGTIFTPGYYGWPSAQSTSVSFGNKIDARKMTPVWYGCSSYFLRSPTILLSNWPKKV